MQLKQFNNINLKTLDDSTENTSTSNNPCDGGMTAGHLLLTPTGEWVDIRDIEEGQTVLCYDKETRVSKWGKVIKKAKYKYTGRVHIFKARYQQFAVVEDHPVISNSRAILDKFIIKPARKYRTGVKQEKFINQVPLEHDTKEDKLTLYEQFLCALQADGSIVSGFYPDGTAKVFLDDKNKAWVRTTFKFAKIRKIIKLSILLDKLGWNYKVSEFKPKPRENDHDQVYFRVRVPVTKDTVVTKNFEDWVDISNKNHKWCKDFIDNIMFWDGNLKRLEKHPDGVKRYHSTNVSNINTVHTVGILAGYRVGKYIWSSPKDKNWADHYTLSFVNLDGTNPLTKKYQEVTDMNVYGITTECDSYAYRYKGLIGITGSATFIT